MKRLLLIAALSTGLVMVGGTPAGAAARSQPPGQTTCSTIVVGGQTHTRCQTRWPNSAGMVTCKTVVVRGETHTLCRNRMMQHPRRERIVW